MADFDDYLKPDFTDWFEYVETNEEKLDEVLEVIYDVNIGLGNDFGAWKGDLSDAEIQTLCKEYYADCIDFDDYFLAMKEEQEWNRAEALYDANCN